MWAVRGALGREATIGAAGPRGSRRSAPVAPALLQVSRRGVRSPRTIFRKGGLPGREWVETEEGAELEGGS